MSYSAEDKVLVELAAKAAGIDIAAGIMVGNPYTPEEYRREWNPLTDDGDALRLAVKLKIEIKYYADHSIVNSHDHQGSTALGVPGRDGSDLLAATRRAIVRAAAEIQLTKQGGVWTQNN